MKKLIIAVLCIGIWSPTIFAQKLITKEKLNDFILNKMEATQEIFHWKDANNLQLWSGLVAHDSLVGIGYKPLAEKDLKRKMHTLDIQSDAFTDARQKIIDHIIRRTAEIHGDGTYSDAHLFPYGKVQKLPYIIARITDKQIVDEVRTMQEVRYFDPMTYAIKDLELKSGEGCSDYSQAPSSYTTGTIPNEDLQAISPASTQSWHHIDHNIPCAWSTFPNQGQGKTIAVFDTGISATNPKYNGQFTEGMSGGRTITKKGFYDPNTSCGSLTVGGVLISNDTIVNPNYDGPNDDCGHGTAMAGLAVAPRGTSGTPAGIAYGANLVSYRVTTDVRLDQCREKHGVAAAFYDAGNDANIDIISMSLGDAFGNGTIEDAVIYAHNKDKLIFCAAGTSTSFTTWYGVIFPAWMPETVAVTGVREGTNFTKCDICHDGNEVDFVVTMQRNGNNDTAMTTSWDNTNNPNFIGSVGGSSAATACMAGIAALAWSNNPGFTKTEILNKLILASSEYPKKDDDFGWGRVDVCQAADSNVLTSCSSSNENEVFMEITNISFPNDDVDFFDSTAEYVVDFNGQAYYFETPESGVSGNPVNWLSTGTNCNSVPANSNIFVNLGNIGCGQSSINFVLETHEDDGTGSDCDYNGVDQDQQITTETVSFGGGTLTHFNASSGKNFIISYTLHCIPTIYTANLSNYTPSCIGPYTATPAGESNYVFFNDSNANGTQDAGEQILQSGASNVYSGAGITTGATIGVVVTFNNGCMDTSTAIANPGNYHTASKLTGVQSGVADYESDDFIESVQLIDASSSVDYDSKVSIELQPNFETQLGAVLEVFIDGCNGGAGGVNLDKNPTDQATSKDDNK